MSLRWGILGLGKIAHAFVKDLLLVNGQLLHAVASRSREKASDFAMDYDAHKSYGSYSELMTDPDVDIIYIATPHNSHAKYAIDAMNHGKHVLCEKPLAVNRFQVQEMIDASRRNRVFLMEALWTRFNPSIIQIVKKIEEGVIGKIRHIQADFAFPAGERATERLIKSDLAGGSILDIGVYPVFLAYLLLGKPAEISARGILNDEGVDMQLDALLSYENASAALFTSFYCRTDMKAHILGEKGSIVIDPRWHETQGFSLIVDQEVEIFENPTIGKGFSYEIKECAACIAENKLESEKWSHADSLNLIEIADELRRQLGVVYPFE